MTPPSDDLHNILFANRPDAIPDENNITVQGILGKSQTMAAFELWRLQTRSARSRRHSSQTQQYEGLARAPQSQGIFRAGILTSSKRGPSIPRHPAAKFSPTCCGWI